MTPIFKFRCSGPYRKGTSGTTEFSFGAEIPVPTFPLFRGTAGTTRNIRNIGNNATQETALQCSLARLPQAMVGGCVDPLTVTKARPVPGFGGAT
jgi:hypothetical protein